MSRSIRRVVVPILALLAAGASSLAVVACGDDEQEARDAIDGAFTEPIESGNMSLELDFDVEGSEQLAEPVRVALTGPFQSNGPDKLPSFDFDVALSGAGTEAVPPVGLISTGDNVFIDLQGTAYELGEDIVAQQNQQLAQQSGEGQSLSALGIDPQEWVVDPTVEGDEEIAGVDTTHVTAAIDIPALVADLNEAVQQASELGGTPTAAPELTEEQQATLEESIQDPTFEVFTGKDDGKLRRLATALTFTVPEEEQAGAGGATGGTASFSLEFADVDAPQEIAAPPDPRPLADLAQQFGGLGGLLGTSPSLPGATPPAVPESGGAGADPQALEEYSQCIEQADPSDAAAIQECSQLVAP